jgi:hypothetical protein
LPGRSFVVNLARPTKGRLDLVWTTSNSPPPSFSARGSARAPRRSRAWPPPRRTREPRGERSRRGRAAWPGPIFR